MEGAHDDAEVLRVAKILGDGGPSAEGSKAKEYLAVAEFESVAEKKHSRSKYCAQITAHRDQIPDLEQLELLCEAESAPRDLTALVIPPDELFDFGRIKVTSVFEGVN